MEVTVTATPGARWNFPIFFERLRSLHPRFLAAPHVRCAVGALFQRREQRGSAADWQANGTDPLAWLAMHVLAWRALVHSRLLVHNSRPISQLTNFLGKGWKYDDCAAAYNGATNLIGPAATCRFAAFAFAGSLCAMTLIRFASALGKSESDAQEWAELTTNYGQHPPNY